ncbi:MAG: hypothetical protein GYA24_01820 [Candidatus Lokiarchaeota archaeon]|nr:hypothetical protein [Candidatus Lokiarchaeota archaeon]
MFAHNGLTGSRACHEARKQSKGVSASVKLDLGARSNDAMQFEYIVGKLLSDIVSPVQSGRREQEERDAARFAYMFARIFGLKDYRDQFDG